MRLRLPLAAAATALVALAPVGSAAPAPQITDAKGDVLNADAGADVVSATFSTGGGAKPNKLIVTVTYAADVTTDETTAQAVVFQVPDCGRVYLERYGAGAGTFATSGCTEDPFDVAVKADGSTLTFTVPFSAVGSSLKLGTTLTDLRTYTALADPVVGFETGDFDLPVLDDATGTGTYKVA